MSIIYDAAKLSCNSLYAVCPYLLESKPHNQINIVIIF